MACRKAAYRAMTELSEWMEEQQAQADAKFAAIQQEQRKLWTPSHVFEACCASWLAHGAEIPIHSSSKMTCAVNSTQGCSGGCGKDHPRVTLDFSSSSSSSCHRDDHHNDTQQQRSMQQPRAIAIVSHPLDPFDNYFVSLCQEGLATPCPDYDNNKDNQTRYYLTGFLSTHLEKMHKEAPFGSHLIKVSAMALSSSRRAHEHYLEHQELERQAKKRKLQSTTVPFSNAPLLESVLEICYNHQTLQQHLDLADISWMRTSCKIMAKYAARLACLRMQQIQLDYSVLGNPIYRDVDDVNELDEEGSVVRVNHNELHFGVLSCRLPLVLLLDDKETPTTPAVFVPQENKEFDIASHGPFLVRVYLDHKPTAIDTFPEWKVLFPNQQPLEVKRSFVDPRVQSESMELVSSNMTFNIVSLDGQDSASLVLNGQPTTADSSNTSNQGTVSDLEQHEHRRGTCSLRSVTFDFNHLLGVYVRTKLPLAKRQLDDIKAKRPATAAEKNYVKALAKAAREAPQNARTFGRHSIIYYFYSETRE